MTDVTKSFILESIHSFKSRVLLDDPASDSVWSALVDTDKQYSGTLRPVT